MNNNETHKQKKALSTMVIGMIIGVLAFGIFSLPVYYTTGPFIIDQVSVKNIWAIMLVIACVVIGFSQFYYNRRMSPIIDQSNVSGENMQQYSRITLFHVAICEAIAIIAVIAFLLLGSFLFFLPFGMSLIELARIYYKVKPV